MAYGEAGAAPPDPAASRPAAVRNAAVRSAAVRDAAARNARPALGGLLLLVVIAGARAAFPPVTWAGPWRKDGFILAVVLDAVLIALLIALRVLRLRRPEPGYPAAEIRRWLRHIVQVALPAVTALGLLALADVRPGKIRPAQKAPKVAGKPPKTAVPGPVKTSSFLHGSVPADLLYGLLALLLAAAIAACVLSLWRRGQRQAGGAEAEFDVGDEDVSLREAVESGRSALHAVDDARAAIIACYVAMEARLARAGAARAVAETPDELLARAQRAGLLTGPGAATLVALFYEARFSSHGLPPAAKDQASLALEAIAAKLSEPAAAGAGA